MNQLRLSKGFKLYFIGVFFITSLFFSCSGAENQSNEENIGKTLFEKNCSLCHGNDGKLMAAGAPDLTVSTLSLEATLLAIEKGSPKKGMPAYGQRFTKEELLKVRDYVIGLRKINK